MYNILCVVCSNGGIQTNKILKRFVAYFVVSAMFVCSVPVLAADEYADKIFNNEVGDLAELFSGNIYYDTKGENDDVLWEKYKSNVWYTLRIELDTETNKASFYINEFKKAENIDVSLDGVDNVNFVARQLE